MRHPSHDLQLHYLSNDQQAKPNQKYLLQLRLRYTFEYHTVYFWDYRRYRLYPGFRQWDEKQQDC